MKVYFVNDTSSWHFGSAAAVQSLKATLVKQGHEIMYNCLRLERPDDRSVEDVDVVVVNGEGTFRDEAKNYEPGRIQQLRDFMTRALWLGKKTYLVNAVWCRMIPGWWDLLKKLDGVAVREPASALEMEKTTGVKPEVYVDAAYFLPLEPRLRLPHKGIGVGEVYSQNTTDGLTTPKLLETFGAVSVSLLRNTWEDVVHGLWSCDVYITGQHHGVLAACKARCPFVPVRVNTHKVTGLFEWAGVDIPIATNLKEIRDGVDWAEKHKDVFEKLFDFMEGQKPWPGI